MQFLCTLIPQEIDYYKDLFRRSFRVLFLFLNICRNCYKNSSSFFSGNLRRCTYSQTSMCRYLKRTSRHGTGMLRKAVWEDYHSNHDILFLVYIPRSMSRYRHGSCAVSSLIFSNNFQYWQVILIILKYSKQRNLQVNILKYFPMFLIISYIFKCAKIFSFLICICLENFNILQ